MDFTERSLLRNSNKSQQGANVDNRQGGMQENWRANAENYQVRLIHVHFFAIQVAYLTVA